MLMAWTMRGYAATSGAVASDEERALDCLRTETGVTGILATDLTHRYERELRLGETITRTDVVESVSSPKETAVGRGWFVNYQQTFTDEARLVVGVQRVRVLHYRPGPDVRPPRRPSPVDVGNVRYELRVPVTTSLVVAGALATRDFNPVHHDRDHARAGGVDDVYVNIYTHLGFCHRLVSEWPGPDVRLRGLEVRLALPSLPGDDLVYRAHAVDPRSVRIAITAVSARGVHVVGAADLDCSAAS
jgi:acyl dehydratase